MSLASMSCLRSISHSLLKYQVLPRLALGAFLVPQQASGSARSYGPSAVAFRVHLPSEIRELWRPQSISTL